MSASQIAEALRIGTGQENPSPASVQDQPDQGELLALLKRLDKEGEDEHWRHVRSWRYNESYFIGNTDSEWNSTLRQMEPAPAARAAALRLNINFSRPTILARLSRLISSDPEFAFTARSTDQELVDAARSLDALGRYLFDEQRMRTTLRRFLYNAEIKGNGILYSEYDPMAGRSLGVKPIIKLTDQGEPIPVMKPDFDPASPTFGQRVQATDETGAPMFEMEQDPQGGVLEQELFEGGNVTRSVDPEDFRRDPAATDLKFATWTKEVFEVPQQWVYKHFGVWVTRKGDDDRLPRPMGIASGQPNRFQVQKRHGVRINLWHFVPGAYPKADGTKGVDFKGVYRVLECEGQILRQGVTNLRRLPYIHMKAQDISKQFYGETTVNDIRCVHATLQHVGNQISTNNDLVGNPRILWSRLAGIPDADKTNMPGGLIRHEARDAISLPQVLKGETVPPAIIEWYTVLWKDVLAYVAGVHSGGLLGGAPPNVEAAAAFRELIDRDLGLIAITTQAYGEALQEWMEFQLELVQDNWDAEREIAVVGRNQKTQVLTFHTSAISEQILVSVVPESIEPQSRAERTQTAITLNKSGLLDKRDTLSMMGVRAGDAQTKEQRQINFAMDENESFLHGVPVDPPMLEEDDDLALETHVPFLFDPRVRANPAILAALHQHNLQHVLNKQKKAQLASQGVFLPGVSEEVIAALVGGRQLGPPPGPGPGPSGNAPPPPTGGGPPPRPPQAAEEAPHGNA